MAKLQLTSQKFNETGIRLREEGDFSAAAYAFLGAQRLGDGSEKTIINIADCFNRAHDHQAALDAIKPLIALGTGSSEAYWHCGMINASLHNHLVARDMFQESVNRAQKDYEAARAHFYLADNEKHLENFDKAVSEFRESIRLNPKSKVAYQYLASLLQALGRHDEALEVEKTAEAAQIPEAEGPEVGESSADAAAANPAHMLEPMGQGGLEGAEGPE